MNLRYLILDTLAYIPVPPDHPFRQGEETLEMPFPRTRYDSRTGYSPNNPRQQVRVHTCKPMYLGSDTVNSLLFQYSVIRGLYRVISKYPFGIFKLFLPTLFASFHWGRFGPIKLAYPLHFSLKCIKVKKVSGHVYMLRYQFHKAMHMIKYIFNFVYMRQCEKY
jgi:hypothetical protein